MNMALDLLLRRQDNVVTRLQSLEYLSAGALRHLLECRWRILLPGVYLAATGTPTLRQQLRAAILYGGPTAQLGDTTALAAYGVRYLPPDPTIRLLLPAGVRRANRDGVSVRRTHRPPRARTVNGLPYCPPERALIEFAARVGDRRAAIAVLADAVQRQVASESGLLAEVHHVTGRGTTAARQAVAMIAAGVRSAPEADFAAMCARSTVLPPPILNALLELPDGRLISPDALWADVGLVHETNGRGPHAREDRFEGMQERHDAMTAAGLIVLHNSPRQIQTEGSRAIGQVEDCYRMNEDRGLPAGVTIVRAGPPTTA
jgi:hypothetical protein